MTKKEELALKRQRKKMHKNLLCPLDGGSSALNFINTLQNRKSENPKDYLYDYEAFLLWCNYAGVIDDEVMKVLDIEAYCYERETKQIFEKVLNARFALYQICLSIIKNKPAEEIYMREFNMVIDAGAKFFRYERYGSGFRRAWFDIELEIAAPLWILFQLAAVFLERCNPKHIKECPCCGSLFYDRSKNFARIYCNPKKCSNRTYVKRYYQANKSTQ